MNKTFLFLLAGIATMMSCSDKVITFNDLPHNAQTFIQQHFPETKVSYAKTDHEIFEKTHEVLLTDGTKIDFYGNGEWKEVDCQIKAVPEGIILPPILSYVQTNFSTMFIQRVENNSRNIEIELSNDLDLRFNKEGVLTEID